MRRPGGPVLAAALVLGVLGVPDAPATPAAPPDLGDRVQLEAFVDAVVLGHRRQWKTPGVAVAVVRGGETLLRKGYGLADLERRRPVDPETTVFPLFSLSKMVTAACVMQQVEEGRLDLRADVNRYLGRLRVPATFPEPITLHHLLTHTSGLDERVLGMPERPGRGLPPLEDFLVDSLPPRIRPPGELIQYSIGHGFTLAGHLVERASGLEFGEYARRRLFEPLGMKDAGFSHRADQDSRWAEGYLVNPVDGASYHVPRVELRVAPGGGLHATTVDMERLMKALLAGGELDGRRVLRASSIEAMTSVQAPLRGGLHGTGYGFFTRPGGAEHAGGPFPHLSSILLLPEQEVGVFFATNSLSGMLLLRDLNEVLLDRYFPRPPLPEPVPVDPGPLEGYEGVYRYTLHPRGDLMRMWAILPGFPELRIRARGDRLVMSHTGAPYAETLVPVGEHVFRRPGELGSVVFDLDAGGVPTRFTTHLGRPLCYFLFSFERLEWWETRLVHRVLVFLFLLVFGFAAMVLPAARGLRWVRLGDGEKLPLLDGWDRLLRAVAALDLVVMLAPYAVLGPVLGPEGLGALARIPPLASGILALAWVAALATLLLVHRLVERIRLRPQLPAGWPILATSTAVLFLFFARYWRLLAWYW